MLFLSRVKFFRAVSSIWNSRVITSSRLDRLLRNENVNTEIINQHPNIGTFELQMF